MTPVKASKVQPSPTAKSKQLPPPATKAKGIRPPRQDQYEDDGFIVDDEEGI